MLSLKVFSFRNHTYICRKDDFLAFYKKCNSVSENGVVLFIDYTSNSVSQTIKKFKQIQKSLSENPSKV